MSSGSELQTHNSETGSDKLPVMDVLIGGDFVSVWVCVYQ